MFFNARSLLVVSFVSSLSYEVAARALELKPIHIEDITPDTVSKRTTPEGITLLPISDPGVLTHGQTLKREEPGNGCFDPHSSNNFFWGAYTGDNLYIANFTLSNPGDDEYILPVENFAKRLKSIECPSDLSPYMILAFDDQDSFSYAQSAWSWVDKEDVNKFTLVTEPDQCYVGDNRSPFLVESIQFDPNTLSAKLKAEEKEWKDIAHSFKLHVGHEYIDPSTANVTHPHLKRAGNKVMDMTHSFNSELFNYAKDSKETAGMALSANAEITTGGSIISDFDIETKFFIPVDLSITIHPQALHADFLLTLNADGTLGKGLDYALKPEIEIPVGALNIKKILEIGPFVTMGVHLGASGLEGTSTVTTGARATVEDAAKVQVKLRHPEENGISGWTPKFEKIAPEFSATIGGSLRAWAELGITIKAEAFGKWGYQAGIDAQLPYFETTLTASYDALGVCNSTKTKGVEVDAKVGINVNLNAGEVNEAPTFQKDLFDTAWPLFSTCMPVGKEEAKTSEPVAVPTEVPESTARGEPPVETSVPTGEEPSETVDPAPTSEETTEMPTSTMESTLITEAPTLYPTGIVTGTASAGYAIVSSNSTMLSLVERRPSAIYS